MKYGYLLGVVLVDMQRSLLLFENSIRSKESKKQYVWYLNWFKNFYKLKDSDSMAGMEPKQVQIMVEDYVMDLKKKVNPNSVPSFVYPIFTFFEVNDIELKVKKIKKLFPEKIKKSGSEAWSTKDVQRMLSSTTSIKNQALIHFLASTAVRIGAIPDMKLKHISRMSDGCKCIKVYEDSTEEYFVFLIPEASTALDLYFEKRKQDREFLDENSPIFRSEYRLGIEKSRLMTAKAIQSAMLNIERRAGLRNPALKKNGRYPQQIDHGFRKRFTTILKLNEKIPVAVTERLLGHKVYSDEFGNRIALDDAYMRAKKEQLFEKFKPAIADLTISDEQRQKIEIETKEHEIEDLQRKSEKIKELELLREKDKEDFDKKLDSRFKQYHEEFLHRIEAIYDAENKKFSDKMDVRTNKFLKSLQKKKS